MESRRIPQRFVISGIFTDFFFLTFWLSCSALIGCEIGCEIRLVMVALWLGLTCVKGHVCRVIASVWIRIEHWARRYDDMVVSWYRAAIVLLDSWIVSYSCWPVKTVDFELRVFYRDGYQSFMSIFTAVDIW